ncbi:hypothetical protein W02_04650 [Nitrospira sp. KM1]|uniref:response regulator n=1 Tax=Nitrospira sp. KM1 TaxID=1936990 RepID=UPI0013A719AC|nr:response regulator [Nitrospira sp. KM1]BCA53325.1 hypothetical protein W02_04650 [Nitrospira sp. KM1]
MKPTTQHSQNAAHTIILIDDSEPNRYLKSRLLRSAGYRVIEGSTGADAIRLAREVKPQLALIDVKLPDTNGLEICRSLKADSMTSSIMVLLTSALAVRSEDKVAGLEEGGDAYLIEPADPDEMLAMVRALLRLYRQEQRLQAAFDIAALAAYTWDPATGRLECDVRFKRMWGISPDVPVNHEMFLSSVHAGDRVQLEGQLARSIAPASDGILSSEFRVIGINDGVERWISVRGQAWFDDVGYAAGFVGTAQDITSRKHQQRDLEVSEARFRAIVSQATAGVTLVDLSGKFIFSNKRFCDIVGYTASELLGMRMQDITHPDDLPGNVEQFTKLIEGGPDFVIEKRYVRSDGTLVWVNNNVAAVRDGKGQLENIVAVTIDISQHKRHEQALCESEAKLRAFAGNLEHLVDERTQELLQSHAQLRALASELNLAEQKERKRLAGELHDNLGQLLALSRIKLSQAKHQPMNAVLSKIVADLQDSIDKSIAYTRTLLSQLSPPVLQEFGLRTALDWLAKEMEQRGLQVTVDVKVDNPRLPEDHELLLFQCVRELLFNCVKHAKVTEARVLIEQVAGALLVHVADCGVGFDASRLNPAEEVKNEAGHGFGLFSTRERMLSIGGNFDLESVPGRGTKATLTLPLSIKSEQPNQVSEREKIMREVMSLKDPGQKPIRGPANVSGEPQVRAQGGKSGVDSAFSNLQNTIRVVIVDDHPMMRQGIRSVLESYADIIVVGEASNGEEALMVVERELPAIVLMDINMPRMNGIEATSAIKNRYPHVIVIGLSVKVGDSDEEAMKNMGASVLLTKEAAVEELYNEIRKQIEACAPRS